MLLALSMFSSKTLSIQTFFSDWNVWSSKIERHMMGFLMPDCSFYVLLALNIFHIRIQFSMESFLHRHVFFQLIERHISRFLVLWYLIVPFLPNGNEYPVKHFRSSILPSLSSSAAKREFTADYDALTAL